MFPLILSLIEKLPFEVSSSQQQKLLLFVEALKKWNTAYNLTAIRDQKKMVSHHIMDSLSVLPFVGEGSIADVGTGAGLPGVPLAILLPHQKFHLIDSNAKKTRFIKQVCHELKIENISVHNQRVENMDIRVDRVISRAFSSLNDFIKGSQSLLEKEGVFLAMKGKIPQKEIDLLPSDLFSLSIHPIKVPGMDAERHLIEIIKK